MTDHYTLKLYASLAGYLPKDAKQNRAKLSIPDQSVGEIIDSLHISPEDAHLVLVNGVYIDYETRYKTFLKDGDSLAIWPPVAGG